MKSIISASATAALTSFAVDFIFGVDQTTEDMMVNTAKSAALGAASGCVTRHFRNLDDSNYLVTGSVGASAGLVGGGHYQAIKEQFGNNGIQPETSVIGLAANSEYRTLKS